MPTYEQYEKFYEAYCVCALWSSTDGENPLDDCYDKDDISPETLDEMQKDCKDFCDKYWELIEGNLGRAGHDFWLTRNHHGAGFWDGDWAENVGNYLTKKSHEYGEVELYVGDDGKIYS